MRLSTQNQPKVNCSSFEDAVAQFKLDYPDYAAENIQVTEVIGEGRHKRTWATTNSNVVIKQQRGRSAIPRSNHPVILPVYEYPWPHDEKWTWAQLQIRCRSLTDEEKHLTYPGGFQHRKYPSPKTEFLYCLIADSWGEDACDVFTEVSYGDSSNFGIFGDKIYLYDASMVDDELLPFGLKLKFDYTKEEEK